MDSQTVDFLLKRAKKNQDALQELNLELLEKNIELQKEVSHLRSLLQNDH